MMPDVLLNFVFYTVFIVSLWSIGNGYFTEETRSNQNRMVNNSSQCNLDLTTEPNVTVQMLRLYSDLNFQIPIGSVWRNGFNITYDRQQWSSNNKLKVFVIPHSHNDPGWLKTFQEYFVTNSRHILNGMVSQLPQLPNFKFLWAEICFLAEWWSEIDDKTKVTAKQLVASGQVEIVTGGWVVADEAVTNWQSLLMELTEGHQWLAKHLDVIPKNGWTIDAFGLSPTMALLLKKAGIENLVINRVHYAVKNYLARTKQLEFWWRQIWDTTGQTEIFTHIMPFEGYYPKYSCGPNPLVCCLTNFGTAWNFDCGLNHTESEILDLLVDQYHQKNQLYKTNTIFVPWGGDFSYTHNSHYSIQYSSNQFLFNILNMNESANVEIKFGTLAEYFETARPNNSNVTFPTLSGDFFTYCDDSDAYWSGFFTTRPHYKQMERTLLAYVRAAEIITTAAAVSNRTAASWVLYGNSVIEKKLEKSRRELSLFQHHDAITGTSENPVSADFGDRMTEAKKAAKFVISHGVNVLLNKSESMPTIRHTYFHVNSGRRSRTLFNNQNPLLKDGRLRETVVLYNSLTFDREEIVILLVATHFVKVTDSQNKKIRCQVRPVIKETGRAFTCDYEIGFVAVMPALSLVTYYVWSTDPVLLPETELSTVSIYNDKFGIVAPLGFTHMKSFKELQEFSIKNTRIIAYFNREGLLDAILVAGQRINVTLEFLRYTSMYSGAYVFMPRGQATKFPLTDYVIKVDEGSIWSSVLLYQIPKSLLKHSVTLFNSYGGDGLGLELSTNINLESEWRSELIMRLSTSIQNNGEFFTDLNGYQMIRRKTLSKLPTQGNYYPMSNMVYIEDEQLRLTFMTSGANGVASLNAGQLEIMLERRIVGNDLRGLVNPVETVPVDMSYRLLIENRKLQCHKTTENSLAGFPSISAHLASQTLLHPIFRLVSIEDTLEANIPYDTNYKIVREALGVDLMLGLFRTNVFAKELKENIGLILHRQDLDNCFINFIPGNNVPISTGMINVSTFFPHMSSAIEVYNASITFMYVGARLDINKEYPICPMDFNSYIIRRFEIQSKPLIQKVKLEKAKTIVEEIIIRRSVSSNGTLHREFRHCLFHIIIFIYFCMRLSN